MHVATILLLVLSQGPDIGAGQVTAALGGVVILREGAQYQAIARSGLQAGDAITTTADGGCIFSINGSLIYLGANSGARVEAIGRGMTLLGGEIRVVNSTPDL